MNSRLPSHPRPGERFAAGLLAGLAALVATSAFDSRAEVPPGRGPGSALSWDAGEGGAASGMHWNTGEGSTMLSVPGEGEGGAPAFGTGGLAAGSPDPSADFSSDWIIRTPARIQSAAVDGRSSGRFGSVGLPTGPQLWPRLTAVSEPLALLLGLALLALVLVVKHPKTRGAPSQPIPTRPAAGRG